MWQRLRSTRRFKVDPDRASANDHERTSANEFRVRLQSFFDISTDDEAYIFRCKLDRFRTHGAIQLARRNKLAFVRIRSRSSPGLESPLRYARQRAPSCFAASKNARGDAAARPQYHASLRRFSLLSSIRPSFPPPWEVARMRAARDMRLRHVRFPVRFARAGMENAEVFDCRRLFDFTFLP